MCHTQTIRLRLEDVCKRTFSDCAKLNPFCDMVDHMLGSAKAL